MLFLHTCSHRNSLTLTMHLHCLVQVLPNRTHPVLLMSGGGGYLLTGTTVATDTARAPAAAQATQGKEEEPASKKIRLEEVDGASSNNSA